MEIHSEPLLNLLSEAYNCLKDKNVEMKEFIATKIATESPELELVRIVEYRAVEIIHCNTMLEALKKDSIELVATPMIERSHQALVELERMLIEAKPVDTAKIQKGKDFRIAMEYELEKYHTQANAS